MLYRGFTGITGKESENHYFPNLLRKQYALPCVIVTPVLPVGM